MSVYHKHVTKSVNFHFMNNTQREQIQQLLADPACKVEDILEIDSCMYLFTNSMPQIVRFFVERAHDLIVAALTSPNYTIQMRAYSILTSDNSIFREAALSKGELSGVFEQFLQSEKPDKVLIFRIASCMEICFVELFDESSDQFWSLQLLINHLDVSAVGDMFKHLINDQNVGKNFMEWLFTLDIDQRIMEVIENLHASEQKDWEFAIGLYEVLDAFLAHPEMLARFMAPNRIRMLIETLEGAPLYVLDHHFKLLCDIVNEQTAPFIAQQVGLFASILQNTSGIHCDFVWAMKIIMRMMDCAPMQLKGFDLNVLVEAAFEVLSSFQDHSIALRAACDCLFCLAQRPEMREEIVDRFVMVAQFAFERQQATTMTSFCYELMTKMESGIDWTGYDTQDFYCLYRTYIVPMTSVIQEDYGGPVEESLNFVAI